MEKILITGCAGFIGFHLCKKLLSNNFNIIGLDNINSYYDVKLKEDRLRELNKISQAKNIPWFFFKGNLEDKKLIEQIFTEQKPTIVFNLAAQAGVRYSLINPYSYIDSNINGFLNILEACRNYDVKNLIYASSSSVYGGNSKLPFSEEDRVDHPISLYAATKKANELLAYSYSHLYKIPSIGIRFFTVYGPWGRPDMAPLIFTKSIIEGKPIQVFNSGDMSRDFTYIDDVVEILFRLINKPANTNKNLNLSKNQSNLSENICPHLLFNIGNSDSISLMKFINIIEDELNIKAIKQYKGMQKGDVKDTYADIKNIENYTGFKPKTNIEVGVKKLIKWYKSYY